MTEEHLDDVYAIECLSFSDPWPKDEILSEIRRNNAICFVAIINNTPAGFITARQIADEGHICNLAVHEDYRQNGIGSALLNALEQDAITRKLIGLTLEVRIGNRAAMALYHKHGFKVEGYRTGYYQYPTEDAAVMWKYFNPRCIDEP